MHWLSHLLAGGRAWRRWIARPRLSSPAEPLDPDLRREVVAFLRDWLPAQARATYREMIQADPDGWHRHPHFGHGVIVRHALRGNGITASALGIASLDDLWPELLREAVLYGVDDGVEAADGAREERG